MLWVPSCMKQLINFCNMKNMILPFDPWTTTKHTARPKMVASVDEIQILTTWSHHMLPSVKGHYVAAGGQAKIAEASLRRSIDRRMRVVGRRQRSCPPKKKSTAVKHMELPQ